MIPSRVIGVLQKLIENRWPVFLWGPPGAGKSAIVREVAGANGLQLLDIRASLLDPTDLRGIPFVEKRRAVWCPPMFLPSKGDGPGILFFDELNAAAPLVQASLYQLTLDRRVGEYELPDDWRIIAAGNRSGDGTIVFRMPSALANRFVHIDFEVDFDDWRVWATRVQIHPLVIGFLSIRRELLFNMDSTDRGFPTPRSWEIVSDTLKALGGYVSAQDLLLGIVGEGAAIEFVGYCQQAMSEDGILKILADPAHEELPGNLGDQYALISYIGGRAKQDDILKAAGTILERLGPELGVLLIQDVLKVNTLFVKDKGYQRFVKKHGSLIA